MLDGDRPTVEDDPLFRLATHVIFSSECLRATTGAADLAEGLARIARNTDAFLAVSNGPDDILFFEGRKLCRMPVFKICAVDTLGAGDAFHGGFVLALAEGRSEIEAMQFGAAVAGIKCTRLGAPPAHRPGPKSRPRRRKPARPMGDGRAASPQMKTFLALH